MSISGGWPELTARCAKIGGVLRFGMFSKIGNVRILACTKIGDIVRFGSYEDWHWRCTKIGGVLRLGVY